MRDAWQFAETRCGKGFGCVAFLRYSAQHANAGGGVPPLLIGEDILKFLAGMLTTLALAGGLLVSPVAGSANAAAGCTYAPTVGTVTKAARGSVNRFGVKLVAGTATPRGTITVRVKRASDGRIVNSISTSYAGGVKTINLGDNYVVGRKFVATFVGNPSACKYKTSSVSVAFSAK